MFCARRSMPRRCSRVAYLAQRRYLEKYNIIFFWRTTAAGAARVLFTVGKKYIERSRVSSRRLPRACHAMHSLRHGLAPARPSCSSMHSVGDGVFIAVTAASVAVTAASVAVTAASVAVTAASVLVPPQHNVFIGAPCGQHVWSSALLEVLGPSRCQIT